MKAALVKPVRCAIYTRVSTDQGLDQEFNSLDAQHEKSSLDPSPALTRSRCASDAASVMST